MIIRSGKSFTMMAIVAIVALVASACGSGGDEETAGKSDSVVIDTSFDLTTLDPARMFEFTGNLVLHHVYDTLLTFEGDDITEPVDGLASYEMSDDKTVLTLTMKGDAEFSDGSPVTVDDAVFSLQRVQGIEGNPSFLLQDVVIEKTSDTTLTLTSPKPNPALPAILSSASLGVVNAKVVQENGGSVDKSDSAEEYLNDNSAGSGPYVLESVDVSSQVVLKANPNYSGQKPVKTTAVIRNVGSETQSLNVQSGESQIVIDLNPDQVSTLDTSRVNTLSTPSTSTIFLLLNQSPEVNKWTANPDFLQAVKYALDYDTILSLGGEAAVRPGSVVPAGLLGSLPTERGNQTDEEAAREHLEASGYDGEEIVLGYPNDLSEFGLLFQPFAETVQSQLKAFGINLKLAPSPTGASLDSYRAGKEQMTIWSWLADYPDPADYLAFLPGELVGLRGNWEESAASAELVSLRQAAEAAEGPEARATAYEDLQEAMAQEGPFIVLAQPIRNIVTTKEIESVVPNALWSINIDSIR